MIHISRTILTRLSIVTLWAVLSLCTSCIADDSEYNCKDRCYFTFNTTFHNTSVILGCVNPMSSGQFCFVRQEPINDVRNIIVSIYGKSEEKNAITTAQEARQSCILGANNGLIIGCSTLNNGNLYAYDRTCPNCYEGSIYKPLQWDNAGLWVKCPRCSRSYDLNNSGYVVSGDDGKKLIRYRSSFDGTYLHVSN